jgi:hypothetical protein
MSTKDIAIYAALYAAVIIATTFIFAAAAIVIIYAMVGMIAFITWSAPATLHFWLIARLGIAAGVVVSIAFALSKEGKAVVDDAARDLLK